MNKNSVDQVKCVGSSFKLGSLYESAEHRAFEASTNAAFGLSDLESQRSLLSLELDQIESSLEELRRHCGVHTDMLKTYIPRAKEALNRATEARKKDMIKTLKEEAPRPIYTDIISWPEAAKDRMAESMKFYDAWKILSRGKERFERLL